MLSCHSGLAGCSEGLRNILEPELLSKDLPESFQVSRMLSMDQPTTGTLDYSLMAGPLPEKQASLYNNMEIMVVMFWPFIYNLTAFKGI